MELKKTQSRPPSSSYDILGPLIGARVVGLKRYSWWSKADISAQCGIESMQAFSLTSGPLGVFFDDGTTLGVASNPSSNSVIVWLDSVNGHPIRRPALNDDAELDPIDSSDKTYAEPFWNEFKVGILTGFSILKKRMMSAAEEELPSEVGLCFHFENGDKFIATHGLHDGSDDFSVLDSDSLIELMADGLLEELTLQSE